MNATDAKASMLKQIAGRSTEQLCYDFAATETMDITDTAVPMVRGWLMDELETRDADAFDAWVFSDETFPHAFYGVAPQQLV